MKSLSLTTTNNSIVEKNRKISSFLSFFFRSFFPKTAFLYIYVLLLKGKLWKRECGPLRQGRTYRSLLPLRCWASMARKASLRALTLVPALKPPCISFGASHAIRNSFLVMTVATQDDRSTDEKTTAETGDITATISNGAGSRWRPRLLHKSSQDSASGVQAAHHPLTILFQIL